MKRFANFFVAQLICFALLLTDSTVVAIGPPGPPGPPAGGFGGGRPPGGAPPRGFGGPPPGAAPLRGFGGPPPVQQIPRSAPPSSFGARDPFTSSMARPPMHPATQLPARPPIQPPASLGGRQPILPSNGPVGAGGGAPALRGITSLPTSRPNAMPGSVNYPKPPQSMQIPGNRPGSGRAPGDLNKLAIRPGENSRQIQRPNFDHTGQGNWWNSSRINQSGNIIGSGNTTTINNNFKNNLNWSTNRNNWGYGQWWNRAANSQWYKGSWDGSWNDRWKDYYSKYCSGWYGGSRSGYIAYGYGYGDDSESNEKDYAKAIGWGLAAWGLGSMIYKSGYQDYSNPYRTEAVSTSSGGSVTYSQPITQVAAETAPASEGARAAATEKSESHILQSQVLFKQKNYVAALEAAHQAIADSPGDGALHEYRALVLFALGKFGDAAGVLNPVLVSGPGWDWSTMITLYDSPATYTTQLRTLENFARLRPDDAAAHFLLGYHYMVCGHTELAHREFATAHQLQPADTVAKQLADLTAATANGSEPPPPAKPGDTAAPAATAIGLEKLAGTWIADKGAGRKVSLVFKHDGTYTWTYDKGGQSQEFSGEYSMNDNGFLVLSAEESQMVAIVELLEDNELKFVLAGGPPGDPGLTFARSR